MELEEAGSDPKSADITPFHFIDLKMKDRTVSHTLGALPKGDEMI